MKNKNQKIDIIPKSELGIWNDYSTIRGMGEKPSPLGEDFSLTNA